MNPPRPNHIVSSSAADIVLKQKLGDKGFQLLQRRLTGARLAFDTLAEVAPDVLIQFRSAEWKDRIPKDMVDLFETLVDRFDVAQIETDDDALPAGPALRLVSNNSR